MHHPPFPFHTPQYLLRTRTLQRQPTVFYETNPFMWRSLETVLTVA